MHIYLCVSVCVYVCMQEEGRDATTDIYWMLPCTRLVKYIVRFAYLTLLSNPVSCWCSYLCFSWRSDGETERGLIIWAGSHGWHAERPLSMAKVGAPNTDTPETASLSDERWQHSTPLSSWLSFATWCCPGTDSTKSSFSFTHGAMPASSTWPAY